MMLPLSQQGRAPFCSAERKEIPSVSQTPPRAIGSEANRFTHQIAVWRWTTARAPLSPCQQKHVWAFQDRPNKLDAGSTSTEAGKAGLSEEARIKAVPFLFAAMGIALAGPAMADSQKTYFPAAAPAATTGAATSTSGPPFSSAVLAGDTLYISGAIDTDPATGKPPIDPKAGAKLILDGLKRTLERAGMTMDDLVWVQIFATDLGNYAAFNEVYRTYFKGPMPARAFLGAGSLLNNSNFEIMGIAVKSNPPLKK